ncbi:MAG TPA: bifunctional hydroxymethylpyrimidine kinase/phosphomethylpyrimidine kinase, partial [Polyangiales bacterium]|nr:bifunctional hydroxymethylpyrimidine kinase/phosphomethylpyrimidine kinase [Polyangiales bacterium]
MLTIAGSDSGGGAGIQADLKTFAVYGMHGLSAIAALTAQNTQGVHALHVPPLAFLRAQLDALFADFQIEAVKVGMLANAEVVEVVADALIRHRPKHIVVDPVMVASSGARLLDPGALAVLRKKLFPLASVLTPNIPEAELLLDRKITNAASATRALDELLALGPKAVLLKGGHLEDGDEVVDRLADGRERVEYRHPRLNQKGHGTGCTLSSAIAASLAS